MLRRPVWVLFYNERLERWFRYFQYFRFGVSEKRMSQTRRVPYVNRRIALRHNRRAWCFLG